MPTKMRDLEVKTTTALQVENLTTLTELFIRNSTEWLDSVVVGRQTCDREIASSTPGRCTAR